MKSRNFTWRSVSDSDQLHVVSPLLQRSLQDLLVLLLLLQQLIQQPEPTATPVMVPANDPTDVQHQEQRSQPPDQLLIRVLGG